MTAGCPNRQRRHTPSSWTTPNPDTTLLGLYFQQRARGNLAHHLRAHVLELVFQLDLLGGGHAVLGDAWCAKRLVQQDVAALGAERHAHRVGENIYAAQHAVASVDREFDFFGSHVDVLSAVHLHPEERPSAASRSIRPLKPL